MKTLAIINIAKNEMGMDDDTYRLFLKRITGKDSLRMMTEEQRQTVIKEMMRKGWKPKWQKSKAYSNKPYVRYIHALWKSCHEKGVISDGSKPALRKFVKNRTDVDDPEFLDNEQATPVIEALKAMENRGQS